MPQCACLGTFRGAAAELTTALCKHFLCVQRVWSAAGCTLCAHAESPVLKKHTEAKDWRTTRGQQQLLGAYCLGSLNIR